jgi:hypothetical protein
MELGWRPFSLFSTGPGLRIFLGYRGVLWRYPFCTVLRRLGLCLSIFLFFDLSLLCPVFVFLPGYLPRSFVVPPRSTRRVLATNSKKRSTQKSTFKFKFNLRRRVQPAWRRT